MPRITNQNFIESTVYDWQRRDVPKNSSFPNLNPKFRTSDRFSDLFGRLPYRKNLNLAQIYTERSRADHLSQLKSCLQKFPTERTLEMRWRFDKEVPAFSMEFLYLYLSRFGKVDAIFQQATNACLVLFNQERVARHVSNKRDLGIPYGRLYTRWWNPLPQDVSQLKMMKHIEKACKTKSRFHSLLDEDDRIAERTFMRAGARAMVTGNKTGGPHLSAYLYEGVKRIDVSASKINYLTAGLTKKVKGVTMLSSTEEFQNAIKADRLVVIDFFATWCGPCRAIAPVIEEFAKTYDDVSFFKVDVDEVSDICMEYNISAMPTFLFFKNNVLLDTAVGAFRDALKAKIESMK